MSQLPQKQTQSLLGRYEQVLRVLVRYGFEDVVAHPPLNRLIPKSGRYVPYRQGKPFHKYTRYERVRMVCEELGTTFIKFAQIASNRPFDAGPYTVELSV
jgi:ubiquinone biosynthesis protein